MSSLFGLHVYLRNVVVIFEYCFVFFIKKLTKCIELVKLDLSKVFRNEVCLDDYVCKLR